MVEGIDSAAAGTFGRDAELSRLGAFVRGADSERALFVEGAPGLGKTTVWESAREAASAGGVRVLAARAAEAETSMSYAVLSDLLADVDVRSMATIPEPQREAIEVALLRAQPSGSRIESRAVPLGVVNMLRALADAGPVLLAIDDLQWVDNATAEALAFALRRVVGDSRVRLLATRRPEGTRAIEAAVAREASATISLTGLTLGATRRLLHARYGLALSRRVARRVHELTLGNPLFALEIGRLLAASGSPPASGDLEVPDSLEELLGERLRSSPVARRAMLAVALGGSLGQDQIASVAGQDAFDAALEAGLLVRQAGRVAPGHPLLAASVIKRSSPADRRSMHGALARVTVDQVRRAHHLAEAATEPGAELAETVAAGASEAATRGAIDEAIELAEQALRLTPPGSDDRPERVLTLGEYLLRGVEPKRLRELMSVELDALPRGTPKARGHLLAAHVPVSQEEYDANLACVLHESEDPRYRVMALVEQSLDATVSYAERLTEAEARAAEALAARPRRSGPPRGPVRGGVGQGAAGPADRRPCRHGAGGGKSR